VKKIKADRRKLEISMARACMDAEDLQKAADMPRPTLNNVISGKSVRPGTIGRIAKALGIDVTVILED
jgi:predicted transcriptional regulator